MAHPDPTTSQPKAPQNYELFVIFLYQLVGCIHSTSITPYLFYQIESFHMPSTIASISTQAGILQGSFAGARLLSSFFWANFPEYGHKRRRLLLAAGLVGMGVNCLGYGFSSSLPNAIFWRVTGGLVSGVDVLFQREIWRGIKNEKQSSTAISIQALTLDLGWSIGPLLSALLVGEVNHSADLRFGRGWLSKYPFALSGIINFVISVVAALIVVGSRLDNILPEEKPPSSKSHKVYLPRSNTKNELDRLMRSAILNFHLSAFEVMWPMFLSTPTSQTDPISILKFTGGLGFSVANTGAATSMLGAFGLFLQPMMKFSSISQLQHFQTFLLLFPLAYFLAPYLAVAPSITSAPDPAAGFLLWFDIAITSFVVVLARNCVLPTSAPLSNTHRSVLAATNVIGLVFGGWIYGQGIRYGRVGFGWWILSSVSIFCCTSSWVTRELLPNVLAGKDDGIAKMSTETSAHTMDS